MQNDILRYKNEFAIKFAKLMQLKLTKWKDIQATERKSLYSFGSILMYLGASLLGFIPGKNEHNYDLNLHYVLAVVFFIGAIIGNICRVNKHYQSSVKSTFFSELLKVFNQNIKYISAERDILNKIPDSMFEKCDLYNHRIESRTDDDIFYGDYKDVKFTMNETDFGYYVRTAKGNSQYTRLFKGLAMHFVMNKEIKTRVLIMPKTLLMSTPKSYEEVQLEDVEFNKKYKVFVKKDVVGESGQIEARYLLNTLFINRFLQLKTSFKVEKIACSVVGDEMLVMLGTNKDLFEMNHLFGKIDDPSQYQHLFDEFASVFSFMDVLNVTSKTKL
jgi:hypothetical protein